MKKIPIIHLGLGNVGKKVMELLLETGADTPGVSFACHRGNTALKYIAIFNSKSGHYDQKGITSFDLNKFKTNITPELILNKITKPFIVIDTTASDATIPFLEKALKKGGYAVLSNKKPLSANQEIYNKLYKIGQTRLFHETTVGAGLPVISSLKNLLGSGDEIYSIEGCFSGTLGFIASSLESGMSYSEAVKKAKELGYTEPDPRDDLSGLDVTRKAIILARMLGMKIELKDVKRTPFFNESLSKLSIPDFLKGISKSDKIYTKMFKDAEKENMTYRYVAEVTQRGVKVGLKKVLKTSPIGSLKGPDNIIVFHSKFYNKNPLVIQGPGAGIEVTAAGVVGDVLQIVQRHCEDPDVTSGDEAIPLKRLPRSSVS